MIRGWLVYLVCAGCRMDFDVTNDASALGPWGPPDEVIELNSGVGDDDPSMTADQLEIYFGSVRAGSEDIYTATRTSTTGMWGLPTVVSELSTSSDDTTVKVAADGLTIFFASNRDGTNHHLFVATRSARGQPWTAPTEIAELANSGAEQYAAFPRRDLLRLVFCAGAPQQLYFTERTSRTTTWNDPTLMVELIDVATPNCDPMEPDAQTIYFSSARTGDNDLYVARRNGAGVRYDPPTRIAELSGVGSAEQDPWVSADQRVMLFSSDRSGVTRIYSTRR